ncbi:MAG: hypothetical protein V1659_02595 [Candidatus Woesearchaeota archaeon]
MIDPHRKYKQRRRAVCRSLFALAVFGVLCYNGQQRERRILEDTSHFLPPNADSTRVQQLQELVSDIWSKKIHILNEGRTYNICGKLCAYSVIGGVPYIRIVGSTPASANVGDIADGEFCSLNNGMYRVGCLSDGTIALTPTKRLLDEIKG